MIAEALDRLRRQLAPATEPADTAGHEFDPDVLATQVGSIVSAAVDLSTSDDRAA